MTWFTCPVAGLAEDPPSESGWKWVGPELFTRFCRPDYPGGKMNLIEEIEA